MWCVNKIQCLLLAPASIWIKCWRCYLRFFHYSKRESNGSCASRALGALSGNGRRPRSRRELNNLTLEDFTSLSATPDTKKTYQESVLESYTASPPSNTPITSSQKRTIRPATSKARLQSTYNDLETLSETSDRSPHLEEAMLPKSGSESHGALTKAVTSTRHTAAVGADSTSTPPHILDNTVQAWVNQSGTSSSQVCTNAV